MHQRTTDSRSRIRLSLVALALIVIGLSVFLTFKGRSPIESSETRFVETSAHGMSIVPASCASSPSYFHYFMSTTSDSSGYVSAPGQSEYGGFHYDFDGTTYTYTYVCITNSTNDTYFVPVRTAAELQAFKDSASWVFCANFGGTCSFSGTKTVQFGSAQYGYTTGTFTNSVVCSGSNFNNWPSTVTSDTCSYSNAPPGLLVY